MDYLRELQRRQSALLARLLTMESSREDSDETDATSQRLAAEQPLRQGKRNGREASSMAPGKKECAAVLREGEEAMQAAPEIGEPLRAAGKRWEEETVGAAGVSAAAETEPQAMVFYRNQQANHFWRSPMTPMGVFSEAAETGGGGTDAEALSRAVQRDARRYDGGFTIF